jgi:hypothetical protein
MINLGNLRRLNLPNRRRMHAAGSPSNPPPANLRIG